MADKAITELVEASQITDADNFVLEQNGVAKRLTGQTLIKFLLKMIGDLDVGDGYTPVKGVDYFTDDDKEELIQEIITALGTPVFGTVDEENNIMITGALTAGTYTIKYEDATGAVSDIGSLTVGDLSNLADPDSPDWLAQHRINSSLAIISDDNSSSPSTIVTNFIPAVMGDVLRVRYLNIRNATSIAGTFVGTRALLYDSGKNVIGSFVPGDSANCTEDGEGWTCVIDAALAGVDLSKLAFVRFNGTLYDGRNAEDVIITANRIV